MADAFSAIPEHQKPEFIKHLEEQQMKDSLKMYNHLVEQCFDKCVTVGWGGVRHFRHGRVCLPVCSLRFRWSCFGFKIAQLIYIMAYRFFSSSGVPVQEP